MDAQRRDKDERMGGREREWEVSPLAGPTRKQSSCAAWSRAAGSAAAAVGWRGAVESLAAEEHAPTTLPHGVPTEGQGAAARCAGAGAGVGAAGAAGANCANLTAGAIGARGAEIAPAELKPPVQAVAAAQLRVPANTGPAVAARILRL